MNMKNILKIFILFVFVVGTLVSCETFGEPEKEIFNVAPLDGRWICYAFVYDEYNAHPKTAIRRELVEIYASGTSDKNPDSLWLHIGYMLRNNAVSIEAVSVKVGCNPQAGTFSITNGKTSIAPANFSTPYYATTNPTLNSGKYYYLHCYSGYPQMRPTLPTGVAGAGRAVSISEGKVTVDGYNTPTGHKTDLIVFTIDLVSTSGMGSYKYVIEGHRHTGWPDDYNSTYDTATAHHKWNVAAYIEEWIWRRDGVWPIPYFVPAENTFHNDYVAL